MRREQSPKMWTDQGDLNGYQQKHRNKAKTSQVGILLQAHFILHSATSR